MKELAKTQLRWLVVATMIALAGTVVASSLSSDAEASSGSSFGGSSFGGGGGSSGGSSGGGYSGGGYSGGGYSGGGYHGGGTYYGGGTPIDPVVGLVVFGTVATFVTGSMVAGAVRQRRLSHRFSVLEFAMAIRADQRDLQAHLERVARRANMSTGQGRFRVLSELMLNLRRRKGEITHASLKTKFKLTASEAESMYTQRATFARSMFEREVLRVDEAGIREAIRNVKLEGEPGNELLDEDGELKVHEAFVLTIVVAATNFHFPTFVSSESELEEALVDLSVIPANDLIGLEVIWTPAAESDSLTWEELDMRWPELMKL